MTYAETINYLFTRLPMFSRVGDSAIKKGLDNTWILCEALDNPQLKFKSIHIAGTNGKGSVSHMLAAVLQTAGYKTGLYTSPHLVDFRERIKINGQMAEEQFIIDFTEKVKPLIDRIEPSFFEITVAMAFDYFARQQVDIAVIETGLGGRLDSTNVIIPELSVITNIGYDHMHILGNTLEKIAFEKAGIIKENVAVVIGETLPETAPVFEQMAAEKKAPLTNASHTRTVADWQVQHHQLLVTVENVHDGAHRQYQLDLPGIYQTKNLLTVLEACSQLQQKGWKTTPVFVTKALKQVKKLTGLHGRWDIIHDSPLVVLDVAHNEDGIKQVVQQIELTPHRDLHIIIGMVKDKEVDKVLSLLPKNARYYFTRAQIPRALPENELAAKGAAKGLSGNTFPHVNNAFVHAAEKAGKYDLIVICGSVFLIGEVSIREIKHRLSDGSGFGSLEWLDLPDIFS